MTYVGMEVRSIYFNLHLDEWPTSRPGKEPRYPLDGMLSGAYSRSGLCGQEKSLDPTGNRTSVPWQSGPYPVHIQPELSQLRQQSYGNINENQLSVLVMIR
jgi:hypothetical protein